VFVDADAAKKVRRLYWIQFESYLPSNDHRYNYAEGNTRHDLWGAATWVSAGPRRTSETGRPGGDREAMMRILARGGYTAPPEMQGVRLVQILDDPEGTGHGRKELMLIYAEDLAPTGKKYSELVANDELTPAFKPLEKPLTDRAIAAFFDRAEIRSRARAAARRPVRMVTRLTVRRGFAAAGSLGKKQRCEGPGCDFGQLRRARR